MPPKTIHIAPGQRFGNCVTVSTEPYQGKTGWRCRCDCGEEFLALPTRLNAGTTTSCGPCKRKSNAQAKVNDLAGQKFGRLQVLRREGSNTYGSALWLCQCDCGSEPLAVIGKRLTASSKPTRSCGCISKENGAKRRIPLEGKTFGLLTVLRYLGEDMVECRCQCGEVVEKRGQFLREGRVAAHCGSPICAAEPDFIGPVLSLADARARGLKHYSPGQKCNKGHRGLYLASLMGCLQCNNARTQQSKESDPERHRAYSRKSRGQPESKIKRNRQLKGRRETDIAYKFVELIRTRIGKVLRNLKLEKDGAFNRSNRLRDAIVELMERQGLAAAVIQSGEFELDHIIPLAAWPWSGSHTANKLTEAAANSASNLQFLSKEQHREKTNRDFKKYNWRDEASGYEDHSDRLVAMIIERAPLPEHLRGREEIILAEINDYTAAKKTRPRGQGKK
jgi:hypothetical protein